MLRAPSQNLVTGIQVWKIEVNARNNTDDFCCWNVVMQRDRVKYSSSSHYREQSRECYKHNRDGRRM